MCIHRALSGVPVTVTANPTFRVCREGYAVWFLAGFLLVRYFRGVCLTVLVIVSLAFVGSGPLGWLPFLAVMTCWWWLRRSRLRRIARQEQVIADEQYRLMHLQAELNARALQELLSRETGGRRCWRSPGLPYQPWTDRE